MTPNLNGNETIFILKKSGRLFLVQFVLFTIDEHWYENNPTHAINDVLISFVLRIKLSLKKLPAIPYKFIHQWQHHTGHYIAQLPL